MKQAGQSIQFYDFHPRPSDFYAEVIDGLNRMPKKIPPKFFYDEKGSQLFEEICQSEEYYPTRSERTILEQNADEIASIIGKNAYVIEPGCGSCEKIRLLLDTLRPEAYVPMDISRDFLQSSAQDLSRDYPWLDIQAACIDFTQPLDLPFCPQDSRKLAFFPGSSIGNFEPVSARDFLAQIADMVGSGGGMLIGVDLKKVPSVLNAAYNDGQGITARFNLNLLERINQELGADFVLDRFRHHAFYNQDLGRVEMHLVSLESQLVNINGDKVRFESEETIHTENSYKYTIEEFRKLASEAGFSPVHVWTDPDNLFSVHYLEVASG